MNEKIDQVGKTAFLVAQWRTEGSLCENPLFQDSYAQLFSTPEMSEIASAFTKIVPDVPFMIQCRTRCIDDLLCCHLENNVRQVLILGSGFDCRPLRFFKDDTRYFEVDKPAVFNFKKEALAKSGFSLLSTPIEADYDKLSLQQLLKDTEGFDCDEKTFVIWEGNSMYLPRETSLKVLRSLSECLKTFTITFDYINELVAAKQTGVSELTSISEKTAAIGALWQGGFKSAAEVASMIPLRVIEDIKVSDLSKKYRPQKMFERTIFDNYSVCTLANQ